LPVQPLRIKDGLGLRVCGGWRRPASCRLWSWRKRDQLIALDFDSRVEAVALRPLSLVFAADDELLGTKTTVRLRDGTGVVVDVVDDAPSRVPDFVPAAVDRAGWRTGLLLR
jgi:hypothetical protein